MVTRIGGVPVSSSIEPMRARQQVRQPSVSPQHDTSGLRQLAGAVEGLGALGMEYVQQRSQEEEERENYDWLREWNKLNGEYSRTVAQRQQELPPTGAGYAEIAGNTWDEMYAEFDRDLPFRLKDQYSARAMAVKQDAILRADNFTRDATRGWSLQTIDRSIDEAKTRVYQNPQEDVDAEIGEIITTAPGLTQADRETRVQDAARAIDTARMGGTIRQGREAAFAVPFSRDVATRIVPAIIGVESNGNPNAESPVGASGLMQVMPETGREIAREINDPNFPHRGTTEEIKAYLKGSTTSVRYGTHYFNGLLKRYGGDIEVALIGYNGGPRRADAFLAQGRNYNAIPEETRNYVAKLMPRIGALTPEMAFDPAYDLSFEQRLAAEGAIEDTLAASQGLSADIVAQRQQAARQAELDAERAIKAQMEVVRLQREGTLNGLYAQAENGIDFEPAYLAAVERGELAYDQTDRNRGREISDRVLKDTRDFAAAAMKFGNLEPMSAAEQDMMIPGELRAGLMSRDEEATEIVIDRVTAMGAVPPATLTAMQQMLYSPNVDDVSAVSQMLSELELRNPSLVRNLPEDMMIRAGAANALRRSGMPADQISEVLRNSATVEGRRAADSMRKTDPNYMENAVLSVGDAESAFNSWTQRNLPGVAGATIAKEPGMVTLFQSQYRSLFEAFFSSTLDATMAREMAVEQLGKTVGQTNLGGVPRLMWMPPEMALQNIKAPNAEGILQTIQLPPEYIGAVFDRDLRSTIGFTPEQQYMIIGSEETLASAREGRPIPYQVIPTNEDGEVDWDLSNPAHLRLMSEPYFNFDYLATSQNDVVLMQERDTLEAQMQALTTDTLQMQIGSPEFNARREEMSVLHQEIQRVNRLLGQ